MAWKVLDPSPDRGDLLPDWYAVIDDGGCRFAYFTHRDDAERWAKIWEAG